MYGYEDMLTEKEMDRLESVIDNLPEYVDNVPVGEFISLADLDTSWLDVDIDLLDILF